MARSVLAVLLGFATIIILSGLALNFTSNLLLNQSGEPTALYLVVNVLYSVIFSMAGGFVTASMPALNPRKNVAFLVIIVFVLGIASILLTWGTWPIWYALLLLLVGPMSVMTGGHIRANQKEK
ncbi:MAG TPA: hypothetical protein VKA26_13985 [Ignavibacteriaceae bacterium]|nr:hypothetical protein [Ignavibacteriaceae bacterium]